MAPKMLTDDVLASLLMVGHCSVLDPPDDMLLDAFYAQRR